MKLKVRKKDLYKYESKVVVLILILMKETRKQMSSDSR
jgi:hypothetical protein